MIKEIDISGWREYTAASSNESPFLHEQWLLLLSEQYKLRLIILGYFENEKLVSAIPFVENKLFSGKTKLISLPFTDYISYAEKLPDTFILELKDYVSSRDISAELRSDVSYTDKSEAAFFRHFLKLDEGYNSIRHAYKKHNQRNIKKALKNGLSLKIAKDMDSLNEFYWLNVLTRKKHGLPTQPRSFFKNICQRLFNNGLGFVASVYYKEKVIASAVFFIYKNTIIYKYGASDSEKLYLRPNNFLFDEVIKYACEQHFKLFDFGICLKENTGLERFKLGWGATEEEISYVLIDKNGFHTYNKKNYNKFFHFILKILPAPLNVLLGEIFYKFAI